MAANHLSDLSHGIGVHIRLYIYLQAGGREILAVCVYNVYACVCIRMCGGGVG